ncbi:potassium transporter 6-like isoform X2 [Asparagus officinalis]|uniref:potassium transporter 6-like isoform X2 n=1 Tax=Asparagus officinalis TaxID=4686 RepID=UPI00098E03F2|nr:potassium transporter 6-like isoform X2 [Asparagus officinalis]
MGGPVKTDTWKRTLLLAFQSLGVVFGHLSIGPLYVFHTAAPDEIKSKEMLYGLMSFVFWTMTLIPFVKYICIVLRVDDNGEGGTFALYSLLCRHARVGLLPNDQIEDDLCLYEDGVDSKAKNTVERSQKSRYMMWFMAMLGSCTVITSGVLVPTISVLSASSSLDRSLEELFFKSQRKREKFGERTEIPFAYAIIIALFVLQHFGTHKIGFLFAPIIIVWLLFIGGLGVYNILHWDQDVFWALSPLYMYKFINNLNIMNWRSLGGVLLCTAGSEAIFADLGHFSKRSIKIAFSLLVYPSLILCYLGQTAYISKNWKREGIDDVTHLRTSVPGNLRHVYPLLSLLSSAVGSQAAITATFSIIKQCLALDCLPRMKVVHTSSEIHGQVYIPDINWILMILSLALAFAFGSISHIGYAIGLAIIIGMLITTCFMSLIVALYWNKKYC